MEEKLLFFSKKSIILLLEPVLGGVIYPVRWHPPDNGRQQDFGRKAWESESESKKVTVFGNVVNIVVL